MPLRFFTVPIFEQISGQQQPAVVVDVGLLLKTILLDLCQNHLDILHYMSVPCVLVCSVAKLRMPYIFGQTQHSSPSILTQIQTKFHLILYSISIVVQYYHFVCNINISIHTLSQKKHCFNFSFIGSSHVVVQFSLIRLFIVECSTIGFVAQIRLLIGS